MAVKNLKKFAKPLIRLMKKKALRQKTLAEIQENHSNASLEDMRNDRATQHANEDNLANEQLEQILYYELLRRQQQQQDQQFKENLTDIVQQHEEQQQIHIPVHFARTAKGTFFWTSMIDVTTATTTTTTSTSSSTTYHNDMNIQHIATGSATTRDRWGQA